MVYAATFRTKFAAETMITTAQRMITPNDGTTDGRTAPTAAKAERSSPHPDGSSRENPIRRRPEVGPEHDGDLPVVSALLPSRKHRDAGKGDANRSWYAGVAQGAAPYHDPQWRCGRACGGAAWKLA